MLRAKCPEVRFSLTTSLVVNRCLGSQCRRTLNRVDRWHWPASNVDANSSLDMEQMSHCMAFLLRYGKSEAERKGSPDIQGFAPGIILSSRDLRVFGRRGSISSSKRNSRGPTGDRGGIRQTMRLHSRSQSHLIGLSPPGRCLGRDCWRWRRSTCGKAAGGRRQSGHSTQRFCRRIIELR